MKRLPLIALCLLAGTSLCFCSCQGLPTKSGTTAPPVPVASRKPASTIAAQPIATPAVQQAIVQQPVHQPAPQPFVRQPYAVQPVQYGAPLGRGTRASHGAACRDGNCRGCQPAAAHAASGCSCEHCQGGPREFRFSDSPCTAGCDEGGCSEEEGCGMPRDEYIWNGCDKNNNAQANRDFSVTGLDQQDTIAHFDTIDGQTETTVANCVPIYAPRFASVRKITSPILYESQDRANGVDGPLKLNVHDELRIATTAVQPVQPKMDTALDPAVTFRERVRGIGIERTQIVNQAVQDFLPFEDFRTIRFGIYEAGEKARLAKSALAAQTWEAKQAVQVVIDGQMLVEASLERAAEGLHVYDLLGKPRLRVVKVASKSEAQVGEEIDFTLRFDNIGDQTVGNVTILDNLTTRLTYVADSQQCSLKSEFKSEENDGETLILKWEIEQPLKVGEGGIIRFRCKVR